MRIVKSLMSSVILYGVGTCKLSLSDIKWLESVETSLCIHCAAFGKKQLES